MSKFRILNVVGARPNFMKMGPVLRELSKYPEIESYLVHTGQHYDDAMSRVFFRDLGMRNPDFNLNVGSASHAVQTADIMKRFEEVCDSVQPDLVIVAGDVNSTMACSLTAAKLHIPVAHIEAGLRSFDRSMPEEINRIVTDSVSDLLFTTEDSANQNLRREGVPEEKIHFVGNTMIDSLVHCFKGLDQRPMKWALPGLDLRPYFLATIHRPSNVDDPAQLSGIIGILESASELAPVFFVTHPRTRERLRSIEANDRLIEVNDGLQQIEIGYIYVLPPLPYLDFLQTMSLSKAVLTDSGGIQEETTYLGIPCLTLRENTERPVTVEIGNNQIVGLDHDRIIASLCRIMENTWPRTSIPPLWDGHAAERIVGVLNAAQPTLHPRSLTLTGELHRLAKLKNVTQTNS
jgi:UDP-N-acetylglucosamine 2-epimerase (non-hydrolysing)